MEDFFPASTRLYSHDPLRRPSKIRIGDVNLDGHSDLLFVVTLPEEELFGRTVLAVHQKGEFTFNESLITEDNKAYGRIKNDGEDKFFANYFTRSASFFDFDEFG